MAAALVQLLARYRTALELAEDDLNRLNVFPVPDRDTGTNTLRTVANVLDAVADVEDAQVATALPAAAVHGARGSSGIILAEILGGFADAWGGATRVGPDDLWKALTDADDRARQAVREPVHGTILTVLSHLRVSAGTSAGAATWWEELADATVASLAATRHQLPALTAAGVVDAGGAGLALLVEAAAVLLGGERFPGLPALLAVAPTAPPPYGGPRYEVMLVSAAPRGALSRLGAAWSQVGAAIAVTSEGGRHHCHVHTDDVAETVRRALKYGPVTDVRCTDMATSDPPVATDVVVVGAGPLGDVFGALGADAVDALTSTPHVVTLLADPALDAVAVDTASALQRGHPGLVVERLPAPVVDRMLVWVQ